MSAEAYVKPIFGNMDMRCNIPTVPAFERFRQGSLCTAGITAT